MPKLTIEISEPDVALLTRGDSVMRSLKAARDIIDNLPLGNDDHEETAIIIGAWLDENMGMLDRLRYAAHTAIVHGSD